MEKLRTLETKHDNDAIQRGRSGGGGGGGGKEKEWTDQKERNLTTVNMFFLFSGCPSGLV
jgi:hypothetical protein